MTNMNISLNSQKQSLFKPKIVVFGVGGAGGNAINNMISSNLDGVEFVAANTDKQALDLSMAQNKLQLGEDITMGLGAGTVPEVGAAAAEESVEEIKRYLEGANMVFITAGMGGGTGTGASPAIAKIAKEQGILTIGIITKPFDFEGVSRVDVAEYGIRELRKYVDTLMIISNQNLFKISNVNTGFKDAFKEADDVLHNSVRSITDLITAPGLINLDFADVKTIIKKMGESVMGMGEAEGESRVIKALESAISNPLLNNSSIKGAKGVIVNISGGADMTMFEVEEAMAKIQSEVDKNANIILGTALNENLEGKIRISIVATGIDCGIGMNDEESFSEKEDYEGSKQKEFEVNNEEDLLERTKQKDKGFSTYGNNIFNNPYKKDNVESGFFNPASPASPEDRRLKLGFGVLDGMQSIEEENDEENSNVTIKQETEIRRGYDGLGVESKSIKVEERIGVINKDAKQKYYEENREEKIKQKKEGRGLFGGLFKSKKDDGRSESSGIKIRTSDSTLKINTMDDYNSDLELDENISEIPAYLRNKK